MQTFVVFFILLMSIVSCVPEATGTKSTCSNGETFDEVKRICVLDESPKLPIVNTTMISLNENSGENSFSISYTDFNGDSATQCTITSSTQGMRAIAILPGLEIRAKNTEKEGHNYRVTFQSGGTYGLETTDIDCFPSQPFCDIIVDIQDGVSTAQTVADALNADTDFGVIADLTITDTFAVQNQVFDQAFQGGTCSCTNGTCTLKVEPALDFDGLVYLDYFLTDKDGTSTPKTLTAVVNNVDKAPVASGVTGFAAVEETIHAITLPYTDADGEDATSCTISNLDANLTQFAACTCAGGVCNYFIKGNTNYFNTTAFKYFDYTVSSNGSTSNTASVFGTVSNTNDAPVIGANPATVTIVEDTTSNATFSTTFSFNAATDPDGDTPVYDIDTITPATVTVTGCLDGLSSNTTGCTLTIPKEYNGAITIEYFASDAFDDSNNGTIAFNVTASDDPPLHAALTDLTFDFDESDTFTADTYDFSLTGGTDEEDDDNTLKYVLWDNVGNAQLTSGTGTNGTLSDCLGVGGAVTTDKDCKYTPNNGNISGAAAETFYYKVQDSAGNLSANVRKFIINLDEQSDIPTACSYSRYDLRNSRTECGTAGCIGDDTPVGSITPSSHSDDNPVVYYDKLNGVCYKSLTTSSWGLVSEADFHSFVSSVEFAEKETVVFDNITINEGGGDAENSEEITIDTTSIVVNSSNSSLVDVANITFKYYDANDTLIRTFPGDSGVVAESLDLAAGDADAGAGRLRVEVIPTSLEYGSAEIQFNLNDDAGKTSTIKLNLTVVPHSIEHKGWNKVKAKGIKTANLKPIEFNYSCPFSKDKCNGGACTSTAVGTPTVTATVGAIFRDGGGNCFYRNSSNAWVSFQPFCNISEVMSKDAKSIGTVDGVTDIDSTTTCDTELDSASCIGSGAPFDVGLSDAGNDGKFYYDVKTTTPFEERCWVNRGGNWVNYSSSTEITIGWESFSIFGGGAITGYNIYRKISGESWDYDNPINRDLVSVNVSEYVDNGTNSINPPIPETVYIYDVRPVLDIGSSKTIETASSIPTAKVRVMSPPDNMVFAHRWMLNREVCTKMGQTPAKDYNYVCEYIGLGDVATVAALDSTFNFNPSYDIGTDLLVSRFELGCPYDKVVCDTHGQSDGSCISNDPSVDDTVLNGVNEGTFFYNRATATCYMNNGAGAWSIPDNDDLVNDTGVTAIAAHLPPLTNIDVENARTICSAQTSAKPTSILGITAGGTPTQTFTLPTKMQQLAYSQWEKTDTFLDTNIDFLEKGESLNAESKCNTKKADGLASNYSDTGLPSSGQAFSLPGTFSSGIRTIYTGSTETAACESMFGIQDHVGNVGEIVHNTMTWLDASSRFTTSDFHTHTTRISGGTNTGGDIDRWANDATDGICVDVNNDDVCEDDKTTIFTEEIKIEENTSFNAALVLFPLGLPIADNYVTAFGGGTLSGTVNDLGTNPYTATAEFHNDSIDLNQRDFIGSAGTDAIGHVVTGGSFDNGNGNESTVGYKASENAGIYSFELVPQGVARRDVGLRCLIRIPDSDYSTSFENE